MARPLLALWLLSLPLTAQIPALNVHGSIGVAGGNYRLDGNQAGFNDSTSCDLIQTELEITNAAGIGGGVRYEFYASDRDDRLFQDLSSPTDQGTRATSQSLLTHFSYRMQQHRFSLPIRAGLQFHWLDLDDAQDPLLDSNFGSLGPYVEIEPELTLHKTGAVEWRAYSQLGLGISATATGSDGAASSGYFMLEAGTKLHVGAAEFGVAFIGRYHSMNRSDYIDDIFDNGYEDHFQGLLISVGCSF
jgi:hypothetical protein